jgi:hypothetical protein
MTLLSVVTTLAMVAALPAASPSVQAGPAEAHQEVEQLLGQLDSDQYAIRQNASRRLDELAARPDFAEVLAAALHQALVRSDLSLEARKRLEALSHQLPRVAPEPVQEVAMEEVDRLVGQLESDAYSERLGAAQRLEWLVGNPRIVTSIMLRLKQRAFSAGVSADARRWLEPIDEKARAAWLASDPNNWDLPPVSDEQIRRWIDDLAAAEIPGNLQHRNARRIAQRELEDLLACDDQVPKVKGALEAKRAEQGLDEDGAKRLQALLDLTLPGLVAEYWATSQHAGTQYLVVGVPSWGQGAKRPSHFDRIDDQTARCASGQNLAPGEYPVGIAIPHPAREDAFFHLVNLPTPRRRLAYEYLRRQPDEERLVEISRRTLARFRERKGLLTEAELVMLTQFDPTIMSTFAAELLTALDDQPLPDGGPERLGGRPSHHGLLCVALAVQGTKAAAPGLLEAIQAQRVLPPTAEAPYRLDWIAALAIAASDPWLEADRWLVGLLDRKDPLVQERPSPPELGATAACALLERHHQNPFVYGLELTNDRMLEGLGVRGCRFTSDDAPNTIRQWWSRQGSQPAAEATSSP